MLRILKTAGVSQCEHDYNYGNTYRLDAWNKVY